MKLICQRDALSSAFQTVSGVVPSRTPKPVLQNIRLEASSGRAVLIGTDSEVAIRHDVPESDIQRGGDALLPAARTSAILKEMRGDVVTLERTDAAMILRGERSEYKLPLIDPTEFPAVGEFGEQQAHGMSSSLLKSMLRRTMFATDAASSRYTLGGVLFEVSGDSLTLAATDTRRLAVISGKCDTLGKAPESTATTVVPTRAVQLIERSLSESDAPVSFVVSDKYVLLKAGPVTIYSRLMEGRFPRWKDVLPTDRNMTIDLVCGSFYAAVRQSQIVTNEESRGVDFKFSRGLLTLMSRAAEVGESKVELPISHDGEEVTITFDPRFVGEFLRVLKPETPLSLDLIDGESVALFRCEDGYLYVVMPLTRDR